jgi:hypothetical protein
LAGRVDAGGRGDQHGWMRPGLRQHLYGAALAVGQVRRGVSEELWECGGSPAESR